MTYRLPTLNGLRAFEAAARHLSFRVAATELGVTAGAISQQVKKLEASLGVDLFRRLPRGLLLTAEGEAYLPQITKVFEDLTAATEAIAPHITARSSASAFVPGPRAFCRQTGQSNSSGLSAYVRDSLSTNDVEMIRSNEIDCLVRLGGGPYGDLASVTIPTSEDTHTCPEALHYVCKPGLADCRQTKAILEDLKMHTTWNS